MGRSRPVFARQGQEHHGDRGRSRRRQRRADGGRPARRSARAGDAGRYAVARDAVKLLAYAILLRPWSVRHSERDPQLQLGATRYTPEIHLEGYNGVLAAMGLTMLPRLDAFNDARCQVSLPDSTTASAACLASPSCVRSPAAGRSTCATRPGRGRRRAGRAHRPPPRSRHRRHGLVLRRRSSTSRSWPRSCGRFATPARSAATWPAGSSPSPRTPTSPRAT